MPTSYTHYRFGQQVRELLPADIQRVIDDHADLFYIGLHGPDLLFYDIPFVRVIEVGNATHLRSGKDWFTHCGKILKKDKFDEEELAYLYGYMCHYALDRLCHGYINKVDAEGKVLHMEIEAELDAYYLKKDGYRPLTKKLTDHLHPSWHYAHVIQKFYPTLGTLNLYACLRGQVFWVNGLVMPDTLRGNLKRAGYYAILKLADSISPGALKYYGLVINKKPNPLCEETNRILDELYTSSMLQCVEFIQDFKDNVKGKQDWSPLFTVNFDGYETAVFEDED